MTREQIINFCTDATRFADPLLAVAAHCELNTALRQAHFLAQIAHESGGFLHTVENLNYSAQGLMATFPKYFPDVNIAAKYARQPEKIGSHVYANRMGNGDEASGDGWAHRGMGLIQITGKDAHRQCSVSLYGDDRLLKDATPLQTPDGASRSAGWFWQSRAINALADKDDLEAVTRKINGGINGIDDRRRWLEKAKAALV